jgi:hypothetical protein
LEVPDPLDWQHRLTEEGFREVDEQDFPPFESLPLIENVRAIETDGQAWNDVVRGDGRHWSSPLDLLSQAPDVDPELVEAARKFKQHAPWNSKAGRTSDAPKRADQCGSLAST